MKKKLIIVVSLIIPLAVWYYAFLSHNYVTINPIKKDTVQVIYATGEVEPLFWSKISTSIAGKVTKIFANEGQKVKKNIVLALLDSTVEQEKYNSLKDNLEFLKKEKTRIKLLRSKDFSSQRDYEKITLDYDKAYSDLLAQKKLLDRMKILSPLNGTVLKREIEVGEFIKPGDNIFWIGKLKPLRITAEVDEEDIPLVKLGQTVIIKSDAFPNKIMKAYVSKITPKGDPINKNFRIRINLDDKTPLLIGMTVEVNIVTQIIKDTLLVPIDSVINNKIWVIQNNTIKEKKVKTGISSNGHIQIIEGIKENENILLNPSKHVLTNEKK